MGSTQFVRNVVSKPKASHMTRHDASSAFSWTTRLMSSTRRLILDCAPLDSQRSMWRCAA